MTTAAGEGGTASASAPPVVVIDASVWVSRLLVRDRNHLRASEWVNRHIMAGGIFASPVLLAIEVAGAVRRQTGSSADSSEAVSGLYALAAMSLVPLDQALVAEAVLLSSRLGLRGPDAVYVAVAKQLAIPLVSLDNEQLTLPSGIIQTIQP